MIAESNLSENITSLVFYLAMAFFLLGFLLGWMARDMGWTLGFKSTEPAGDPNIKSKIKPLLNPAGVASARRPINPPSHQPPAAAASLKPTPSKDTAAASPKSTPAEDSAASSKAPTGNDDDLPAAWQGLGDDLSAGRATIDDSLGLVYTQSPEHGDDLQAIKGVGKVLNDKLNGFGIYTYRQIAGWDEAIIAEFSTRLSFKDRVKRDNWVGQAKTLHNEKYNEALG